MQHAVPWSPAGRGGTTTGRSRAARWRLVMMDSGWAVAGTVFCYFGTRGSGEYSAGNRPLDLLAYVLALTASASMLLLRTWPRPVLVLVSVLAATYLALDYTGGPIYLFVIVATAVVGWYEPLSRSLPMTAGTVVIMVAAATLHLDLLDDPVRTVFGLTLWSLVAVVPWALAALARMSHTAAEQATSQRLQHQADEERMQIAREVHDVVGHSLAVISMQAGVALHVAERRPEQGTVALEAIARASREALDDLRSTLAVLRGDEAPAAPHPGLADLTALVADFSTAGHRVDLALPEKGVRVPAATGLAAYRIVQESLTNVVRHSDAGHTRIDVRLTSSILRVEVSDDGRLARERRHGGSGLTGMRERCAALGGTLEAGPQSTGGWRVLAELPMPEPVR